MVTFWFTLGLCLGQQPKSAEAPKPAAQTRTDLNLLGKTDTQAGESRRNENVQFNLIDNNALKELNVRLGTTATIQPVYEASRNYWGVEFGNPPTSPLHVAARKPAAAMRGSLYATHGNSIFSGRSFFQVGGVKPARENNYGFSVAAPIGRLGFLSLDGSQQKIRGNVNGNVLVPLPSERTLMTNDPAVRALLERWIHAYPLEPPNRPDINERALNTNATQAINTDTASLRWDRPALRIGRLTWRHNWTSQNVDAFQLVAGQNPDTSTRSHDSRLTWERVFNANNVLQASLGFNRVHSQLAPEPNAVGPQVQIGTAFTALGPGSNVPLDRVQNRFREAALMRMMRGRHTLQWGAELTRLQFNGSEASSNRGNFYFRNDFGRDAISNFRRGIPSRYSTGIGDLGRGFRRWEQLFFVGDTWQVNPTLTLHYGVRFEPVLGLKEVNGLTPVNYGCDCNNWAPRFGFAQRLPGSIGVLRGAYGIHYGELFAAALQQLRWNAPAFLKIERFTPSLLDPLAGVAIDPNVQSTVFVVPDSIRTPYGHQYNLSWEGSLHQNWKLQVGYVGSRMKKLLYLRHRNRAASVPGIALTTATIPLRRPDQRYNEARTVDNMGLAYFDAGRVTLVVPSWRGMSIDASYWWSKALDAGGGYTNTAAGDDSRNGISQTDALVIRDLKGPSAFDQTHAALVRWNYSLPAGRNRWLRNWSASVIWLGKTGMPFQVLSGSDGPGFGNVDGSNGDRPNVVDPSILGRKIGHPDTSRQLLPASAFAFIRAGEQRGNLGRNTFRRGGIRNMNAALSRSWRLASERSVVFRAESVNLTNTAQFAEPNADLTSPAFGMITNTLNDGRAVQFTLQLHF
jgi:hypothetical protein